MIRRLLRGLFSVFLVACCGHLSYAADTQETGNIQDKVESRSAVSSPQAGLEALRLRFRLMETVEFPLRLREIDSAIKIARARIESLERLQAEYARFQTSALVASLEKTRVQLFEQKQKLKDLKFERLLLQESYKQERRWRILEMHKALQRAKATPRAETTAAR